VQEVEGLGISMLLEELEKPARKRGRPTMTDEQKEAARLLRDEKKRPRKWTLEPKHNEADILSTARRHKPADIYQFDMADQGLLNSLELKRGGRQKGVREKAAGATNTTEPKALKNKEAGIAKVSFSSPIISPFYLPTFYHSTNFHLLSIPIPAHRPGCLAIWRRFYQRNIPPFRYLHLRRKCLREARYIGI
jgi:hypothetical protein